jgi:uncharacterized protein YkwD
MEHLVVRKFRTFWMAGLIAALLAACGGGADDTTSRDGHLSAVPWVGPQPPQRDSARSDGPDAAGSVGREQSRSTGGYAIDVTRRETVRLFYAGVFKASEGVSSGWTGTIAGCVAGDTSADYKDAVLRRINWFRAMAGVPANVQFDATFNRKAQEAALVMAANNNLSHTPPSTWTCNNANATEAAGSSNLALGRAGPESIASGYMEDGGSNNTAVGHRRWLLYPQTQTMGTGDVTGNPRANALWVFDNRFGAARPIVRDEFVAWPPPGFVPYTTVYPRWSFSYPKADFSSATVSMRENGVAIATRKETISNGAGENTLVWLPGTYTDGMTWSRPAADTTYTVQISGVRINGTARNFSYSVNVFDPDVAVQSMAVSGSDSVSVGQATTYTFEAYPGATQYQWRSLQFVSDSFVEGAEGNLSQVVASTSGGYDVQISGVSASGSQAFHLAHPQPIDQTLTLQGDWVPNAQSMLVFSSRLGLSSPNQKARVQVSQDGGSNWSTVSEQAGTQSGSTSNFGELSFSDRQVSLAAFSGRTVQVRFLYGFTGGSYYPQTSNTAGWFIDDIRLEGVNRLTSASSPNDLGVATQLLFTPKLAVGTLLQVRAGMFGHFGEWGPVKLVNVSTGLVSQPVSDAAVDCLLNWAQTQFPSVLAPASAASQTISPYRFRFYSQTGVYLGLSMSDANLYAVVGGKLQNFGAAQPWLTQSGCAGR